MARMRRFKAGGAMVVAALGVSVSAAFAGPPSDESLVQNINPAGASSSPAHLTTVGSTVFFAADDGSHGVELWKTDGTTATLVKDINPTGASSSNPDFMAAMGGLLYFRANDGTNGAELWRSNGTEAGTTMVKDIWTGLGNPGSPVSVTPIGNTLFFSANDGTNGRELWKSNGTEAGTVPVADINTGPGAGSTPANLTNVGGTLFFAADPGGGDTELYTSDGASASPVPDINPGAGASNPEEITAFDGKAFFRATDGSTGVELWKSDGTSATQVANIRTGGADSDPTGLTPAGGTLFFRADDGPADRNLWKSDGTGASLVADTNPGGGVAPIELINLNGTLLYQGTDGGTAGKHGVELWRSDGTVAGTVMVKDINPGTGDSYPGRMTKVGNYVVFVATQTGLAPVNSELWRTDGTTGGTAIVEDIRAGAGGLDTTPPPEFAVLGASVLFGANDGTDGTELWKAVDTIAPQTTIDSGPANGSSITETVPSFTFSSNEPDATFQCALDGAAFAACASPQTTAALALGSHTFAARAIDPAANTDPTPATRTFTVAEPPPPGGGGGGGGPPANDSDPPETTIGKQPKAKTTKRKAKFSLSSSEPGSTFECELDKGDFEPCAARQKFKVKPGKHRAEFRAIDPAGNRDPTPAVAKWTVKR